MSNNNTQKNDGLSQTGELTNSQETKEKDINPKERTRETGETILADYAGKDGFNRLDLIPVECIISEYNWNMEWLIEVMEGQIHKAVEQRDKEQLAWLKEKAHLLCYLAQTMESFKPTFWDVSDFVNKMTRKAKRNAKQEWFRG